MEKMDIEIKTEYIKLDQLLKYAGIVDSGANGKQCIKEGNIKLNDQIETQRGKKIYPGDRVEAFGQILIQVKEES